MHLPIALFLTAHFFNIPNPIHLLLRIGFLTSHLLRSPPAASPSVGKRSLRHPTAVLISTHRTSHLLGCNLPWSNSIGIWTTSYSLTTASWWRVYWSIFQPGRWLAVWRGRVLDLHEALGLWNCHAGVESTVCCTQWVRLPGE